MTATTEHRICVRLRSGPVEHLCQDERGAVDLFDRLRLISPTVRIERLQNRRVVEVAGLS